MGETVRRGAGQAQVFPVPAAWSSATSTGRNGGSLSHSPDVDADGTHVVVQLVG